VVARKRSVPLTEAEQRLMEIVWKREAVTVSDVVEALSPDSPLAYTSVQTIMKILEQKGYVEHREAGRAFVYSAVVDRRSAARTALTYVMQRFFGGSPERLALNLVEDEGLTLEQLENIRTLIDTGKHAR
jgi:predicted transcriptional regulator